MPEITTATIAPAGFAALGLDARVLATLTALGYEEPTSVQEAAIPPMLAGRDVLAQAATGTGKTAAFALPLLHRITPEAPPRERTTGLILVPTRELAMQVAEAVHKYGRDLGVSVVAIYGGAPMDGQIRTLKRGVDVVVATPGRALDHINRKTLHLAHVKVAVLDEADEMLDMGFAEDLEAILGATPAERQTALFSATMPAKIQSIARAHLNDPVTVTVDRDAPAEGEVAKVRQVAYIVARAHKMAALGRILDVEQPTATIVFCRTRGEVDELTEALAGHGMRAEPLHGGMSQDQRDRVMKKFRAKKTDLLVATDVAARGLDVKHVTHVVNYDVPADGAAYVHRIGRTGRAGREGVAITLAEPREHRMLRNIERVTKQPIEVAALPTVADLHAKRLEITKASLRDAVVAGSLDAYRSVAEALATEFDVMDVAAAAIKLLEGKRGDDAEEIPGASAPRERPARGEHPARDRALISNTRGATGRPAREFTPRERPGARMTAVGERASALKPSWEVARIFIGGGRKGKVRPTDLVGAIIGEANVPADKIGAVVISDRFATVEVPAALAATIITKLQATTIKGKKLLVKLDRAGR
ncbi:MAG: DEAD/DEAH box helicase [Gemmatimonadetes bacterium]|nr:DEAD/DEAH box helicase [Gemmatimonadota bacterium]MBI3566997.1 DEAD/DEAH box helicase [Gemmatimonadota bacterium]